MGLGDNIYLIIHSCRVRKYNQMGLQKPTSGRLIRMDRLVENMHTLSCTDWSDHSMDRYKWSGGRGRSRAVGQCRLNHIRC